jgi:nicotinate dehydrogenase subunit A
MQLNVNGRRRSVDVDPGTALLHVLRNDLGLTGTRFGCGLGQCGACFVLVDGRAVASCTLPVHDVADADITTVEGLGTPEAPGALQQAFLDEQAGQCGYCLAGMVVAAAALLRSNGAPSERDVRTALDANLCRCGSQQRIVRAVLRAAGACRSDAAPVDGHGREAGPA